MIKDIICHFHPTEHAHFICESCGRLLCNQCTYKAKHSFIANTYDHMCPKCSVELTTLGVAHTIEPFWKILPSFFKYPFQSTPMILIALLTLVCTIGSLLIEEGLIFLIIYYFIYLGAMPLILLYYCNGVLVSTAKGNLSRSPFWIEVKSDNSQAPKQFLLLLILSVFGVIMIIGSNNNMIDIAALVVQFFQPAIIIIMVSSRSLLQSLNPIRLLALISKIGWPYCMLFVFIYFLFKGPIVITEWLPHDISSSFVGDFFIVAAWQYYMIVIFHLLGYVMLQYHTALGYEVDSSDSRKQSQTNAQAQHPLLAEVNMMIMEGRMTDALELIRVSTKGKFDDPDLGLRCVSLMEQCGEEEYIPIIGRNILELLEEENRSNDGMTLYKKCITEDKNFSISGETLYWLYHSFSDADKHTWVVRTGIKFINHLPNDNRVPECQLRCADLIGNQLRKPEKAMKILHSFIKKFPDNSLRPQAEQMIRGWQEKMV